MTAKHILICGAGIGGLTAATAYAKAGARVTVFERAEKISEVGAGIQQSPNAMAVHAALGTASDIAAYSFAPDAGTLRDYKTGAVKLRTQMDVAYKARYGHPYLHIHRADLIAILLNHAKRAGTTILTGHSVSGYKQDKTGITALTNQGDFQGDLFVGADGINSLIAGQMHGETPARFTGQMAWRGTVKASDVPSGIIPKEAAVWVGPGAHFVTYYLRGGELINFVAVKERSKHTEESWSKPGDMQALQKAFSGWDAAVTALLSACTTCFEWGLFDRPVLPTWHDGRAVLLGDACHPMLPFMAQGAAMAIEDAWALSQLTANADDLPAAFSKYETMRKPRASKLQAISTGNAAMFHAAGPAAIIRDAKLTVARALPLAAALRFDPIYGYDITKEI